MFVMNSSLTDSYLTVTHIKIKYRCGKHQLKCYINQSLSAETAP